jgi:hypothetical protein
MYIYRGETMGLAEPVASIRLKILRRGAQDYEYFWLLSQKEGSKENARRLVNSVLVDPPGHEGEFGHWKRNAEEWDAVRIKVGEMLHKVNCKQ